MGEGEAPYLQTLKINNLGLFAFFFSKVFVTLIDKTLGKQIKIP